MLRKGFDTSVSAQFMTEKALKNLSPEALIALVLSTQNQNKILSQNIKELQIFNTELEKSRIELEKDRTELKKSNSELEKCNTELEKSRIELEKSNAVLENKNGELSKNVETLNATTKHLSKRVSDLEAYIAVLEECKRLARIEKYCPSSEQLHFLFDEVEVIDTYADSDDEDVVIKEHKRKKSPRHCTKVSADTPVYVVDNTKDAPSQIERNGNIFVRIEDEVTNKLAIIPAKVIIEKHLNPKYLCKETDEKVVLFKNPETESLSCSPSMVANIAVSKYDDHTPLYRQSEILERIGVKLSRTTMARWLITFYGQLNKVEKYFEKTMYKMKLINLDESPLPVLDFRTENGSISKSSFMYIRQGATYNPSDHTTRRLISCSYIQNRKKHTMIDDYLRYGSTAYVMTDGLSSYEQICGKHCNCWVHAVRKLKQILRDREERNAKHAVRLFQNLYNIENECREKLHSGIITPEEFLLMRKERCIPVIDELYAFLEKLDGKYPEGNMARAISYILNRKDSLKRYLDILEAPPDNNVSERIAKAFATGRKNWLFSKTVDGADTSCFMYSAVENAKANGLNPEEYLEFLFTFGPLANTDEELEALLPWNADLSKLSEIRTARAAAQPDPKRKEPYTFTGLNHSLISVRG